MIVCVNSASVVEHEDLLGKSVNINLHVSGMHTMSLMQSFVAGGELLVYYRVVC